MKTLARLIALLALLIPTTYAAETGYTLKATEVKDKPFLDATTLATLPEKTTVEILMRQGAWMQIKTANAKPNAEEVEKMKSFAATTAEAAKLAESGKLAAKPVAYFDERGKPLKGKK